jgi:hypothetical protein
MMTSTAKTAELLKPNRMRRYINPRVRRGPQGGAHARRANAA